MNGYQAKVIADTIIEADAILQGTGFNAAGSLGDHMNMHLKHGDKYIHMTTPEHVVDPWKAMFMMLARGIKDLQNDGS